MGFENLRPNAQAALVSLVFNRGSSMTGANRLEMRNLRPLVSSAITRDGFGVAEDEARVARARRSKPVWCGGAKPRRAH
jgi:hypothetical protein